MALGQLDTGFRLFQQLFSLSLVFLIRFVRAFDALKVGRWRYVGAGINFDVLFAQWGTVVSLAVAVIAVKAVILLGLALLFGVHGSNGWLFTLGLAQAGEFGFVLLTYSVQNHVIPVETSQGLSLEVALSMFLTPLLFIVYDRIVLPRYRRSKNDDREADAIDEQAPVIVAGVGRFGQIVCRLLRANNVPIVALDHEREQIENLRQINIKSFFGDASRPDLLETAGIEQARLLVVAIDDRDRAVWMVEQVKQFFPGVWVLARAFDRGHGYQLREAGADGVVSETYHSALELGGHALTAMGVHPMRARQVTWAFWIMRKPTRMSCSRPGRKSRKVSGLAPVTASCL